MSKHRITVEVEVEIDVHDESVITRCVENHNDRGEPQEPARGGRGWRDIYYGDVDTPERVIEHLAYNYVVNGTENVGRLDGWADLGPGAVSFTTGDTHYLWYEAVAG